MLDIINITKKYENIVALNDVTFCIPDKNIYGLIGENGAGKSTLLRLAAGISKADSGEIKIDGKIMPSVSAKRNIFYMPDNQYYPRYSTPLSIACFYKRFYLDFDMDEFRYILNTFELDENKVIDNFSKGMKKQVFIAAGICACTKYMFCDEIFDGLDPVVRKLVNQLLRDAMEGRNMTIVMVSHHLEELEKISTMKGFLHRGKILNKKERADLYADHSEEVK